MPRDGNILAWQGWEDQHLLRHWQSGMTAAQCAQMQAGHTEAVEGGSDVIRDAGSAAATTVYWRGDQQLGEVILQISTQTNPHW